MTLGVFITFLKLYRSAFKSKTVLGIENQRNYTGTIRFLCSVECFTDVLCRQNTAIKIQYGYIQDVDLNLWCTYIGYIRSNTLSSELFVISSNKAWKSYGWAFSLNWLLSKLNHRFPREIQQLFINPRYN